MSGYVSKRVQANRKSGLDAGGFKKSGSGGGIGMPSMLRRIAASRAPDGGKNVVVPEPIWREIQKITPNDGAAGDYFGRSVAVSGNIVVVGAYWDDDKGLNSGSAYVYQSNGGTFTQLAKLTASDGAANDNFGFSVAVSGNIVVVGAATDDDKGIDSGSAYVFKYS